MRIAPIEWLPSPQAPTSKYIMQSIRNDVQRPLLAVEVPKIKFRSHKLTNKNANSFARGDSGNWRGTEMQFDIENIVCARLKCR